MFRILFPNGLNTAVLWYLLQSGKITGIRRCTGAQCILQNAAVPSRYVLQISFTNIEDKMNLMPQINILKLDEILSNRSSTNTNPAAEGTFDFLAI